MNIPTLRATLKNEGLAALINTQDCEIEIADPARPGEVVELKYELARFGNVLILDSFEEKTPINKSNLWKVLFFNKKCSEIQL